MKTAVSIPDVIFDEAERLARRAKRSRSEIYSRALQEYLARHQPDGVTAAIDQVIEDIAEESPDRFTSVAARQVLNRSDW
jgi:predicted transcriptional regulator